MDEYVTETNTKSAQTIITTPKSLKNGSEFFETHDLNLSQLPLNIDILSYLKENSPYHTKIEHLFQAAAKKIIFIWEETRIPICENKYIKEKIGKLLTVYKKIKRNAKHGPTNENVLGEIFNVTHCKCMNFLSCECAFKDKINKLQYNFLINQTSIGEKLQIDEYCFCEVEDTPILDESFSNLSMSSMPPLSSTSTSLTPLSPSLIQALLTEEEDASNTAATTAMSNTKDENHDDDDDPDYQPKEHAIPNQAIKLPNSIKELNTDGILLETMRFDSSFASTAAIMNRTFESIGAITNNQKGLVITPSFLKYRFKKLGNKISDTWMAESKQRALQCFFFDGVSMYNKMSVQKNNKQFVDKSVLYDNIAIVEQPGNHYLGFISTFDSDAESIYKKLLEFFKKHERDLSSLIAIGSDGAATNVGVDAGVIRKFEKGLQSPIHRIICLLHLLELILKAVICAYFGEMIGPYKNTGAFKVAIETCHTFRIQTFERIELKNMPSINGSFSGKLLNSDQKFLYEMGKAVNDGIVDKNLAVRKPGELSAPRWTIAAIRMLRLYVSTDRPSHRLKLVVMFIQHVYIPMLFSIKLNPYWTYGCIHIYNMLVNSQSLDRKTFNVVKERIQFNSFFAHSENVLMSLICDHEKDVRRAAYQIILSTRNENDPDNQNSHNLRVFKKPNIAIEYGVKYKHYWEIIDWNKEVIHEPPFTRNLKRNQLIRNMESDDIIQVPLILSHSQYTEFYVQTVKRAVTKYVGHETQDERIKSKIIGRRLNTNLHSRNEKKSEYQLLGKLNDHM